MKCHQILTGACNPGDRCFAVGTVEGVPFTAYAAGCNIVILANTFERVQVIPGACHDNIQISCVDCSADTGKIATAYGKLVCIFEPTPLLVQNSSSHRLDYRWIQTGKIEAKCYINTLSWNLEGTRILTAGDALQMWASPSPTPPPDESAGAGDGMKTDSNNEIDWKWQSVWECNTATPTTTLSFSPDGTLFATCSNNDRLVKIWYDNKLILYPQKAHEGNANSGYNQESTRFTISYGYIYLSHPSAVTGFTWRSTSKYMPKGSVGNMLLTSCRDNICRVWAETILPDDGLVSLHHIDPVASQNPRFRMHRHKHRFMQRLKHIKTHFHLRRHAKNGRYSANQLNGGIPKPAEPIPSVPSMYSIHDFHMYGIHASGITPGFHFHLAATINAETDIPLVPSINNVSEQNFVIHWLNNKEMFFTSEAENILIEVSKRALDKDISTMDSHHYETEDSRGKPWKASRPPSHMAMRGKSFDEEDVQSQQSVKSSHPPLSTATSSTSIATDITTANSSAIGDALDKRIETLLRDWLHTSDMLFSIHPVDGSLLLWILEFLDCEQGSFRQAQVSFCARLPNALPLGDAMTMSPNLITYNGITPYFLKTLLKIESMLIDEDRSKTKSRSNLTLSCNDNFDIGKGSKSSSPFICMTTKHSNGSLNLWHITVAEDSKFTQVLNISHFTRVCGHRFQLNDIKCHPVLPLLLTTSHHNKQQNLQINPSPTYTAVEDAPLICIQENSEFKDWCSELILWRVDAVGPLNKSGGVTELSRINSPQISAFSNAAWIPTLLPSTTLGHVSNSPSACFVASDGESLRVYQAVIDGRALLAEISTAERKKKVLEQTISLSTDSSLQEHMGKVNLSDIFNIVSEQSTSRPGCIIQLDTIIDAAHDWQNTQFLHVFQERLIRGEIIDSNISENCIFDGDHSAIVDLNSKTAFEEPFYVTLIEKTDRGSIMHMWRLVIASEHHDDFANEQIFDDVDPAVSEMVQKNSHSEASPVIITTSKIYCEPLLLPSGVEVVHCCPAAGHLSSASIYPACYAPYLLVTACSDNIVRFWRCKIRGEYSSLSIEWQEWALINKDRNSSIKISGQLLHVNAAYSGRIAVAYERSSEESCVSISPDGSLVFSCMVSIYECESTGGSEWVLSDTIELKDVVMNQNGLSHQDIDIDYLDQLIQNRSKLTSAFSNEDLSHANPLTNQSEHLGSEAIHSITSQMHVPSHNIVHSIKSNRFENKDVSLKQKHPIQLGWLSVEDGSHLLTIAIGSKILVYTSVSEDLQESNEISTTSTDKRHRPVLQKSVSMHQMSLEVLPSVRWMRLGKISLKTADQLAPLPMQISWVRDGILVLGMDNEMQVFSQWPSIDETSKQESKLHESSFEVQNRDLSQARIRSILRDSLVHCKSGTAMSKIPSYSVLSSLDSKMKTGLGEILENPISDVDELINIGIFEASRITSPILPQYHPRQLMELLNAGKIRRVKAIIAHLLRCLMFLGQRNSDSLNQSSFADIEDNRKTGSRSRTLSASLAPGSASRENRNSISFCPEDINLDNIDIQAIPPLPLWLLLEADKENQQLPRVGQDTKEDTYAQLFGSSPNATIDMDELLLSDVDEVDIGSRRKSLTQENRGIGFFGPRQAQYLAGLLTRIHLPGLSSLDQLHLLALADTVASCNVDFADRFDISKAKEAMAKETYSRSATDEPSMESLDDCGVRFLLAMRQRTYLMRCLPIGQRAILQKAGIGCHNIVWAFHSESQEELLDFIPAVRQGNIRWPELRELGAGWWIRSNTVLTKVILKVAKAAFLLHNNPLDAAIYYLAMQKKSLVWGLFRSISDKRMTDFFANNFSEERWRVAALKNAFALMGKQRFEHAAAFFLLAGALKDAVEVVLNKLNDEQLAFIIIRFSEGELDATPPSLQKLLYSRFLGYDEEGNNQLLSKCHPDPFYRSLAFWMLKDYNNSLNTLLLSDPIIGRAHAKFDDQKNKKSKVLVTADPSVFNFYIYLRTHPMLVRQCVANNAKDTGYFMASRLGSGQDNLDKKSLYESSMTPLERRLYFTTASAYLCSGCPTLALAVLSKLPDNVIDLNNPDSEDLLGSPKKTRKQETDLIKSGTFDDGAAFELTSKATNISEPFSSGMDWSTPISIKGRNVGEELALDFSIDNDADLEEDDVKSDVGGKENDRRKHLDIMAQQLKFICCLKMMMEELSTLATGCEVDGGQFRYQLYIWLEREVDALKEVCNYRNNLPSSANDPDMITEDEEMMMKSPSPIPMADQPATLHEILQQENMEFENKRKKAVQRKQWLVANQQLLRTLLSYCSLHGSSGGGLASVRVELIFLLQELQQENNKQQLVSPLPLPTTLPLLSAYVASNKTVVVDPVRHLQCGSHDLLLSLIDITSISIPTVELMAQSLVLRNLSVALSACIYQSVCDSENLALKNQPRLVTLGLDLKQISIAHKESHLLSYESKNTLQEIERYSIFSSPSKWPGVASLLALITHEKDEDSPRLNILLCESLVAIYLCLLIHGFISSDPYVLYRLISINFKEKDWGSLFGGGVKKVIKVITNVMPPTQNSTEKEISPAVAGERILSTISNLQKTRIKLNMKFLGQLGFQDPRTSSVEGDTKSGTREQFWPPELSIISYLMAKRSQSSEIENIDYDSSESDEEDIEIDYEEDEDVFKEPKVYAENIEHSNTDSYSWCLLRLACMRQAQYVVAKFLEVSEVDLQGKEKELAVSSPLLHSINQTLALWTSSLVDHIEEKEGPPPEYIPGCFVQSNVAGPAILKYKALLETHNTPFERSKKGAKSVNRLWSYLVRQEQVQDIFVRYIFGRKQSVPAPITYSDAGVDEATSNSGDTGDGTEITSVDNQPEPSEVGNAVSESSFPSLEPVRIIHKEHDSISSFCINKINPNLLAIASMKEVQELDISLLLKHPSWLTNECALDVLSLNRDPELMSNPNYLVVQTPLDKALLEGRGMDHSFTNATSSPILNHSNRGSNVLNTYKIEGTRRTDSHPVLPLYLLGCQDGSVVVREWKHSQVISQPRPGGTFAKVTRVRFNQQGNKFGVIDGDGHLSLFHMATSSQNSSPFYTHQCHNKHGNDFTYVGSSSLIATAGQSSEHKNIALWDTLMPQRKANIVSWNCHDYGASALLYAPQHQVLISAGKKGQVCIFDIRQRTLRHKFQSHESAIKCMALDITEDFFVTGSADGDMKVWGLSVHNLVYNLPGEHSRTSLFKNLSQGVTNIWLDSNNHLFSCGADGSVKLRSLPERDLNVNML